MKPTPFLHALLPVASVVALGCAPLNSGVPGSSAVTHPAIDGTVFTIVFENQNADDVITPAHPNFWGLASAHGQASAYISYDHPSLLNYIVMTSGSTNGITNDNDPLDNVAIGGTDNLASQLDAAGIPWRAYMESMEDPCVLRSTALYNAHHDPFLYYTSLRDDEARCRDHVVDFDANFAADLAADTYRYMWITPNECNDFHDCPVSTGDAWLGPVVAQIMASPGYQRGGVIFILTDEGYLRIPGWAGANVATIVISPQLVSPGFISNIRHDHRSYLATVEDIFGLPRLATTVDATPMGELFVQRAATAP